MSMFHASLRAMVISRLVSEMYPPNDDETMKNNLHHAGAVVRAALTYTARQEHAPLYRMLGMEESEVERHDRMSEWGSFVPAHIVPYLPPDVVKSLQSQVGGMNRNLPTLLVRMSKHSDRGGGIPWTSVRG